MIQRGRKSATGLAVLPGGLSRLPEPPLDLPAAEADVWRHVVATRPVDWFGHDTFPLLAAYCRATVEAERAADLLKAFDTEWTKDAEGLKRYEALVRINDRLARSLTSLATKMRLSQQARYQDRTAARLTRDVTPAEKPWERAEGTGTSPGSRRIAGSRTGEG